jgi:hypothetical protein
MSKTVAVGQRNNTCCSSNYLETSSLHFSQGFKLSPISFTISLIPCSDIVPSSITWWLFLVSASTRRWELVNGALAPWKPALKQKEQRKHNEECRPDLNKARPTFGVAGSRATLPAEPAQAGVPHHRLFRYTQAYLPFPDLFVKLRSDLKGEEFPPAVALRLPVLPCNPEVVISRPLPAVLSKPLGLAISLRPISGLLHLANIIAHLKLLFLVFLANFTGFHHVVP